MFGPDNVDFWLNAIAFSLPWILGTVLLSVLVIVLYEFPFWTLAVCP